MKYIDIHGHLNFPEYDADREEVINRAQEAGVGMISVGTDLESSKKAIELAETHENMWAIVGIHPTEVGGATSVGNPRALRAEPFSSSGDGTSSPAVEFAGIKELARHPKVVAVGECGLDYFHSKPGDMEYQRELFIRHIELANEVGKPLMLHVRNGKGDSKGTGPNLDVAILDAPSDRIIHDPNNVYLEAIQILKRHSKVPANFHFFAGTIQDAQGIVEIGNTMSFTGVLTFARNCDEIIKTLPLTHIMSETDCPFVAPVPYRGKRNEPSYAVEVVKKIAEIRGEDVDKVARQLMENARRVFVLPLLK